MKIKNYALCALAVLALSLTNCNDDDNSLALDDGHVPSCNETTNERCLYAKVENASEYSDIVEVRLMTGDIVLARGNWVGDGFTIGFPETIDPNYFHALEINGWKLSALTQSTFEDGGWIVAGPAQSTTLTVSDKDAKMLDVWIDGINKDGRRVAIFRPEAINEDGVEVIVHYTYVDSDVIISGYTVTMFTIIPTREYIGPMLFRELSTYSIEWKNGWNVWWSLNISWDSDEPIMPEIPEGRPYHICSDCGRSERVFSTDSVYGLKWYGRGN